jgi:hypothetical protein
VLEKAQDIEKKHNLEVSQGNHKKRAFHTNPVTLANIAVELGIVHKNGHPLPQNMLDSMVSLDAQRAANFEKFCKQNANQVESSSQVSTHKSEGNDNSQGLLSSVMGGMQGGSPKTPKNSSIQIINIDDSEDGWLK